jgi:hypothetical protein
MTTTQSRKAQSNVTVSESKVIRQAAAVAERAMYRPTIEEVKAQFEARVMRQLDRARSAASTEQYEPEQWADIFVVGPIQFAPPALLPSQVIAIGETAFLITVLALNPALILPGPISPKDVLEGFNLDCTLRYRTGNLDTWELAESGLQVDSVINLSPGGGLGGGPFYIDVQAIAPTDEGLHEVNISSRILGAGPGSRFAGFATWSFDVDGDFLATFLGLTPASPEFFNKVPVRYDVYQP